MGRFRHDPIAPFKKMTGMVGFLARKAFAGGTTRQDKEWAKGFVGDLSDKQEEDGSWQNAVPATAFNVMRLLNMGFATGEPCIERAIEWLLARPVPVGFPGLYMSNDRYVEGFNKWKRPGTNKRRSRTVPEADKAQFRDNRDIFGVPDSYCELRFLWTNGLVVGTLLRCGLDQHPRVIRGIHTLLKPIPWCGCGVYNTRSCNFVPADDSPVDLNDLPRLHVARWVATAEDIRGWVAPWQGALPGVDVGDGLSLISHAVPNSGDCARAIYRGLSYHPDHHGSDLEAHFARECVQHQSAHGVWRGHYLSFMFGMLQRCMNPLSKYAVLRSVPILVNRQRANGLWNEADKGCNMGMSHGCEAPPSARESSFSILSCLKQHGFLKRLLPKK